MSTQTTTPQATAETVSGNSNTTTQASQALPTVIGPLAIQSVDPIHIVSRDDGLYVVATSGGAQFTNQSQATYVLEASATQRETRQHAVSSVTYSNELAPGGTYVLVAPPSGMNWTILIAPRKKLQDMGWWVVGGALFATGVAAYGTYALGRDLKRRYDHHRDRRSFRKTRR